VGTGRKPLPVSPPLAHQDCLIAARALALPGITSGVSVAALADLVKAPRAAAAAVGACLVLLQLPTKWKEA